MTCNDPNCNHPSHNMATCRLCRYPFVPVDPDQLHCTEECESTDRKIDEAEARREERL